MDNIEEFFTEEVRAALDLAFELVETLEGAEIPKLKSYQPEMVKYGFAPDFTQDVQIIRESAIQTIHEYRKKLIHNWFSSPRFEGFERAITIGVTRSYRKKEGLASRQELDRLCELVELTEILRRRLAGKQAEELFNAADFSQKVYCLTEELELTEKAKPTRRGELVIGNDLIGRKWIRIEKDLFGDEVEVFPGDKNIAYAGFITWMMNFVTKEDYRNLENRRKHVEYIESDPELIKFAHECFGVD